ncbi:hypothetical protein H0I29_03865 [Polaribacter sp. R2A056_3_33]|jgi:hypothetical protein|uniref:hypothetical protein n=1 Tax=Polaribacter sp. R2A056_3_33 TaxID=2745563 RepID=UPI001C4FDB7D|nr:hypothetical protein [Polaribacter sp. R2A056_3_33]QXP71235.1 hypothetical protein H0I29_03865 [Polaribacter sp. R2A056_3_33]
MDGAYIALRGYKFQFDRTILELFNNSSKTIEIEQLQDYGFDDYLIQVKYHNTDYNASQQKQKVKKPLVLLFEQFLKNRTKKFILLIYLKGVLPSKKTLTVPELDLILGKLKKFSLADKTDFVKCFTLIYAEDFEIQYKNVIQKIKSAYSKSDEEAEIYYSMISSHLLDIVTKNPPSVNSKRKTSKNEIDKFIHNGKKLIYKSTYVDVVAKEKQLKNLNKIFFKTSLNTEPHERIFIIEVNPLYDIKILKEIVLSIKIKWSKNKTKTIPDTDRFVPIIYFNGLQDSNSVKLKSDLQKDGYVINDGYNFLNAPFNVNSFNVRPTFNNKLFFKFINNQKDLKKLLNNLQKTGEIYQFFTQNPSPILFSGKHIKIEIEDIEDIKNII